MYSDDRNKLVHELKTMRRRLCESDLKYVSVKLVDKFLNAVFSDMEKAAITSIKKNKKMLTNVDTRGNKLDLSDLDIVLDNFADHIRMMLSMTKENNSAEEIEDLILGIMEE